MEGDRIVKYYSEIDHRWLYIDVNYETYKYFDRQKKLRRENRKSRKRKFEESLILYDPYSPFVSGKYCEDKNINVARQIEDKEFNKIVWGIVDNLEDWQKAVIVDHYIYGYDFTEIGDKYGKSKSGISQIFDVIYHHLRLLLLSDPDFQETDFAVIRKQDYLDELKKYFDKMKGGVVGGILSNPGGAMENIISFAKELKQEIKILEKMKNPS